VATPTPTPDWIEAQPLDPTPAVEVTATAEATDEAPVAATPTTTEVPGTDVPVEGGMPTIEGTATMEPAPTVTVIPNSGGNEPDDEGVERPTRPAVPRSVRTATAEVSATAVPTGVAEPTATNEVTAEPTAPGGVAGQPTSEATPEATGEAAAAPTATVDLTDAPGEEAEPTATTVPTVAPTVEPTATIERTPTAIPPTATLEPTPTEVPPTPVIEPTPTMIPPTAEPVLVELESSFTPVADTSVSALAPDQPPATDATGTLSFGGPDGTVAYVTFDVSGIAPGSVVAATLTVTGAGLTGGPGGALGVLSGVWVDEAAATWNTRPTGEWAALDADGAPVWISWIEPGGPTTIDVTGTVTGDGTVTFVFLGDPAAAVAIASRESSAPPLLVIHSVVEQPVS
jgi:hypothetical protein